MKLAGCALLLWGGVLCACPSGPLALEVTSDASFLIFFGPDDLSIVESEVERSPTSVVWLFSPFFRPMSICSIYLGPAVLGAYVFAIFVSSR